MAWRKRKGYKLKHLPYGRQTIDAGDIRAVSRVLGTDWITQGPEIGKFEKALADYCGSRYAVVVSSGTAALHIACLAAGLRKGDEAVTTPVTFLATANSVIYCGAKPIFSDIDETVNLFPEYLKQAITGRTKVFLPVHFAGLPCDMEEIHRIAKKENKKIIEDASHALGAEYKTKAKGKRKKAKWVKVGSCEHSDMTVFSFHPVKHITTGEGGAVTTNSRTLYEKLKVLRTHGIYKTREMAKDKGLWYYEMRDLGFNYRITDIQCALGCSQLKKADSLIKKRRKIAEMYDNAFDGMDGVDVPARSRNKKHVYHLYVLKIDFKGHGITRKDFMLKLRSKGILAQVHYIPVYRQPFYRENVVSKAFMLKEAEEYYEKAVSIPMYPSMRKKDVERVIAAIKGFLRKNGRKK